ncbi:unnamed protein product, partial [marine sediment metagenome]
IRKGNIDIIILFEVFLDSCAQYATISSVVFFLDFKK